MRCAGLWEGKLAGDGKEDWVASGQFWFCFIFRLFRPLPSLHDRQERERERNPSYWARSLKRRLVNSTCLVFESISTSRVHQECSLLGKQGLCADHTPCFVVPCFQIYCGGVVAGSLQPLISWSRMMHLFCVCKFAGSGSRHVDTILHLL